MANIGSIYATRVVNISEGRTDADDGDGRTDGPSILFPIAASFLAAAVLSLTFITSILAIARKGRER